MAARTRATKPAAEKSEDQAQAERNAAQKNVAENPDVQQINDEGKPLAGAPTPSGATADPKAAPNAVGPGAVPANLSQTSGLEDKHGGQPRKKVADLTSEDLVDQVSGAPRPISATTENLSAS